MNTERCPLTSLLCPRWAPQPQIAAIWKKSSVWMCFAYCGSGTEPASHCACNECQQMFYRREKSLIKLPPKSPLWEQQYNKSPTETKYHHDKYSSSQRRTKGSRHTRSHSRPLTSWYMKLFFYVYVLRVPWTVTYLSSQTLTPPPHTHTNPVIFISL